MLIKKDGVTRNIDSKRLQEYKEKGYTPAENKADKPPKK